MLTVLTDRLDFDSSKDLISTTSPVLITGKDLCIVGDGLTTDSQLSDITIPGKPTTCFRQTSGFELTPGDTSEPSLVAQI